MKSVTDYIQRKSLLYKTNVEYGDYTINHVQGCSHGCLYPCYAFLMAKRFGKVKSFEEWLEPCIVSNALELLEKEIPKHKSKIESVHLSFTTDPFMYQYEEISDLSIEIIKKLNSNGIKCTVLTKGILPEVLADFSLDNQYGITLISLNEAFRKEIEKNSAPYIDRINSLRKLHEKGCKTWVSIEPYPTPNIIDQDFLEILESVSFADKIIFGRTNYNTTVSKYPGVRSFYNNLCEKLIDFCNAREIEYYIKDGTLTK
ncbi:radical SAM protein [Desulfuribacillus stibiiarsenatis]|uniref:Radical SAM protein n=1 Tax=Desulfuribacillus stibiiarsenatis TaxID=1390249 RepID=A0A1E5L7F0_9FIRM|nr:radical SAM protein [Desulfuribacillus stibiiarsenatis]OEH86046.1 radical SAM protein [Desulfuribacillus stibiiarsenatis]